MLQPNRARPVLADNQAQRSRHLRGFDLDRDQLAALYLRLYRAGWNDRNAAPDFHGAFDGLDVIEIRRMRDRDAFRTKLAIDSLPRGSVRFKSDEPLSIQRREGNSFPRCQPMLRLTN